MVIGTGVKEYGGNIRPIRIAGARRQERGDSRRGYENHVVMSCIAHHSCNLNAFGEHHTPILL